MALWADLTSMAEKFEINKRDLPVRTYLDASAAIKLFIDEWRKEDECKNQREIATPRK